MSEQRTRIMYAKDMQERIEAEDEFADLETLYNEVSRMNQVMKLIHVRLFVSGRTVAEVENNAKEIMNHLESNGYKSVVFLNECQHEWQSMFYPIGISNAEAAKIYARNGQPCTSSALAGGDPFHFTSLNDEYGSLYGTSTANGGGKIMLDLFHKDNQRTSYNGIIIGKMGSGKSTLLKKMLMDRAVRGDYIRGYDPSGEFRYLVEELGGSIVSLDGTDGILNMMQIMMSAEIDSVSYVQHISKLNTIYKFLVPDAPQPELLWYEKMIRKLYIKFGIIPEDEQIGCLVSLVLTILGCLFMGFMLIMAAVSAINTEGGRQESVATVQTSNLNTYINTRSTGQIAIVNAAQNEHTNRGGTETRGGDSYIEALTPDQVSHPESSTSSQPDSPMNIN